MISTKALNKIIDRFDVYIPKRVSRNMNLSKIDGGFLYHPNLNLYKIKILILSVLRLILSGIFKKFC